MIDNQIRELTLIYHSEKSDDRKARGYVESLRQVTIKTLDLAREQLTETQLAQLADKMGEPVANLIDPTYDDRGAKGENQDGLKEMDTAELLVMIKHNPMLLDTPIVILGDKAHKYKTGYNLIRERMGEGVNSISDAVNREEQKDR
jgi:arsenate reductase-like glutaredoxin family protein